MNKTIHINNYKFNIKGDLDMDELYISDKEAKIQINLCFIYEFDAVNSFEFLQDDKTILEIRFNIYSEDYNVYWCKHGVRGNTTAYINKALSNYPEINELLGECISTGNDYSFSNLKKITLNNIK